jgi:hypothetical protein
VGIINNFYHALAKFRVMRYKNTNRQLSRYTKDNPVILTFLCPNAKRASGGTKVIYRFVSLINQHSPSNVIAQIFHAAQPSFRCDWHYEGLKFKDNYTFNSANEIYFLHEMWAAREAPIMVNKFIAYGILVQGGYLINRKANYEQVEYAYAHALWIICVSQDIEDCLRFLFPHLAHKIVRLHISVDATLFKPANNKENVISYMPRRLKKHAELVLFFLAGHLPSHWRIEAIDGLAPEQVASKLGRSKIFMSFSELEGLGLPPIEAALAGNKVIGYTGQGGKEFWHAPIFEEVNNGDIRGFAESVLRAVSLWDNGDYQEDTFAEARNILTQQYAQAQELADLARLTQFVATHFKNTNHHD